MNSLHRELMLLTEKTEAVGKKRKKEDGWSPSFHLSPPTGWLNDPNGLCFYQGMYHGFFQYSPFDAEGGLKFWGHSASRDLFTWNYLGAALCPDQPFDCHGVYSGSALVEGNRMTLFYTGNIKESGDFDYITEGRQGNLVMVSSDDGIHFGEKEWLMKNSDYPSDCTCHVRDPKVWKDGGIYHMVQGARNRKEYGEVLYYQSEDKKTWKLRNRFTTDRPFGYMWECPDFFMLDGQKILSVSPQGVSHEMHRFQNIYQSGYFLFEGEEDASYRLNGFEEWDYGFDFYAPQTFEDDKGRRILIGWMGMPDTPKFQNKTLEYGWQHTFTLPRVLQWTDGRIYQKPAEEILEKRGKATVIQHGVQEKYLKNCEIVIENGNGSDFAAEFSGGLMLSWDNAKKLFAMTFKGEAGGGRDVRRMQLDSCRKADVFIDASCMEVFVNDGEKVMSTRYYPTERTVKLDGAEEAVMYPLG
ncbi:glycoside hydrolase family 32 protein [Clostridium sp. AM58-1XD]|uniref:glycoside hydrolase family 32 protein n=1 Tax=Clostridium sp. AM58-1XD TaxID=2292307 RepID=UPI000E557E8C|nr:glycoside hydrolase family 32 protein [Clostridium sp. AM58-1XD]RGY96446.1 glycosyl hydrolase family 32 [Clostridium sp. AM58-1XD]